MPEVVSPHWGFYCLCGAACRILRTTLSDEIRCRRMRISADRVCSQLELTRNRELSSKRVATSFFHTGEQLFRVSVFGWLCLGRRLSPCRFVFDVSKGFVTGKVQSWSPEMSLSHTTFASVGCRGRCLILTQPLLFRQATSTCVLRSSSSMRHGNCTG